MTELTCRHCKETKPEDEFRRIQDNRYCNICKLCSARIAREWYRDNKKRALTRMKQYRADHREALNAAIRARYSDPEKREHRNELMRLRRAKHHPRKRLSLKGFTEEEKKQRRREQNRYYWHDRKSDPVYYEKRRAYWLARSTKPNTPISRSMLTDEERIERRRQSQKKYYEKKRQDPQWMKEASERAKIRMRKARAKRMSRLQQDQTSLFVPDNGHE